MDKIILANFNQLWKLDQRVFDIWLRVMKRFPNTVLWLLQFSLGGKIEVSKMSLYERAKQFGVDPSRIIFGKVSDSHHSCYCEQKFIGVFYRKLEEVARLTKTMRRGLD